ncbi:type 1 glutamine amidotransferase [Paenibacillus rhizosphaerae]|uniref:Type 1 glutamine amidotransferase n=1 Tax=Paenibacillus rhizosphaerae TaxID=297318 RepID=A0A839TNQ6_9BACL|nr:ThuA domain-containing protein [Paenibacillus rhizosphaerae]MBB3128426.1 type 1 glutamine amidotransferase [Paenibacillus rhizosphaerae]
MMKKEALIIWNDFYHPKEVLATAVEKLFPASEWNVRKTERARDLLDSRRPDLTVFFTNGRPEGETDLTFAEQSQIVDQVFGGMGILFYHAGLVLIDEESPFYKELNSGRFVHHPEQSDVTVTPLCNVRHPITEGVRVFCQNDEHYFCQVDVARTHLLACATSAHLTSASVWCHDYGKGRVAGISQGHTLEMQNDPEMLKLATNALNWLTDVNAGSRP